MLSRWAAARVLSVGRDGRLDWRACWYRLVAMPTSKPSKNQRMSDHFAPTSLVVIHPHFRTGGKAFDWSNALGRIPRSSTQRRRLHNHRHQAAGPASLLAKPAPPVEHQVGVHVVAPRHNRYRNPGLVALRYDPALLGIALATTKGTRAFPPGPRILHCFRHLRSCPLRPWWTPNRCQLPIAQPRLITLMLDNTDRTADGRDPKAKWPM